jgi:NAD(P)-dependent dehydrogenase (short-subunit alcohol dehydrogenase family)
MSEIALIVGAGPRLGLLIGKACAADGMRVALAARSPAKIAEAASAFGARAYACDATQRADVERLFESVGTDLGAPDLVVFNPAGRLAGPIETINPDELDRPLGILRGAFLVAQAAAKRMLAKGSGTILFTGASTSVQGPPEQSAVAMYKFGIRGLAQALARELHPKNVHVGHVVVSGGIGALGDAKDTSARPEEIAKSFLALHRQHRSVWAWETVIGPWTGQVL